MGSCLGGTLGFRDYDLQLFAGQSMVWVSVFTMKGPAAEASGDGFGLTPQIRGVHMSYTLNSLKGVI